MTSMSRFACLLAVVAVAVAQRKVGLSNTLPSKIRTPSSAAINSRAGTIDARYPGLPFARNSAARRDGDADLKVDKRRRLATIKTDGGQQMGVRNVLDANGRPTGNTNYVFDGRRGRKVGTASLSEHGARANTDRYNPGVDWTRGGREEADIQLDAAPGRTADVQMRGDDFDFTNNRNRRTQSLNVARQSRTGGDGTLRTHQGKSYAYRTDVTERNAGKATLQDPNGGLGRSSFKWDCTGAAGRTSQCVSANGRRTGGVATDDQNGARVQSARGVQLARVETEKVGKAYHTNIVKPIGRGSNTRSSKPLYLGKAEEFETRDCYREVANRNDPNKNDIKLLKPLKFTYNAVRQPDGSELYSFPDCFKIGGTLELAPNVNMSRIAVEFRATVSPIGEINCADPGTCGRGSCYYCDLCNPKNSKMRILRNYDTEDVCSASGGRQRRVAVEATFCPPPDTKDWAICTDFSRSAISGYWNDKKAIMAKVLIWQRPEDEQKISDQTLHKLQSGTLTQVLQTEYFLNRAATQRSSGLKVSDEELRQYAIRKKESLLSCTHGEIDYDIAGSKISGKFLVTMSDALKRKGFGTENIFGEEVCPKVRRLETQEHDRVVDDWESRGKPEGGLISIIGGGLGGGRGGSGNSGGGLGRFGSGITDIFNRG